MFLPDVNVLVYAFRPDANAHEVNRCWLQSLLDGDAAYGCSDHVLSGFLRVVTHPKIFTRPDPLDDAVAFAEAFRNQPHCIPVSPGRGHWQLFTQLCEQVGARGNLIPDAFFAALAIESSCEWVTTDRDYSRFPGLRWRHPADEA